jgi:hypothetical protein
MGRRESVSEGERGASIRQERVTRLLCALVFWEAMMPELFIGCSGFSYRHWRGTFYLALEAEPA